MADSTEKQVIHPRLERPLYAALVAYAQGTRRTPYAALAYLLERGLVAEGWPTTLDESHAAPKCR